MVLKTIRLKNFCAYAVGAEGTMALEQESLKAEGRRLKSDSSYFSTLFSLASDRCHAALLRIRSNGVVPFCDRLQLKAERSLPATLAIDIIWT
ncbi:hypothetical protein [Kamptonema sp. UHCC 0994]|uniref:hypothetical protein n=1 Tax=Kamptonema sp. UHCC 0994 TaxID=3031329 RepID=UPI0023B9D665|nr:hypothetical protein [Kamptonema sp. UHCC 0994]MDF0555752.1 hypothetical protein [Kamptonema sp. UHCC 0994]